MQWAIEHSLILAGAILLTALASYLLAAMRAAKKISSLEAQLSQASKDRDAAQAEKSQLALQLKTTEQAGHDLKIELGTTAEKLNAANEKFTDAINLRDEARHAFAEEQQKLEAQRKRAHEAERQLETAQEAVRSRIEKIDDLTKRLEDASQLERQERVEINRLKDLLADEGKKAESLESRIVESQKHFAELRDNLASEKQRYEALQQAHQDLNRAHTQLKTEQDEREASHAREVASFDKQKESLAEQFKLLSNEILEAKTKSLQESSKLTLSSVMSPFQQSIDSFKKEVQEIHHRDTHQQGELRKELESLKELNQKITTEAHELSTALRGQKKLQGNWGELVLENVLDRSGLQLGKDYQREVSFTTEEGRQRPDAVVYLPQGKHLIIDAKVSLNSYTRYVNAEDELERGQALKEHVQAVGSRIKELADRDYYKLPGLNSPEMVFMFIPIESAFVEALKADENLFQQAIENNVLVATPTTLLTSLNIVRQLWRYEDQNKHTAALANKAEAVFKKLNTFLGSFERIKKGLDSATEAYTKAENQLVSGKGNLVKQVGDFKNLAPAIKAELPSYFADKAALEIDFIPANESESNEDPNSGTISDGTDEVLSSENREENSEGRRIEC